MQVTKNKKIAAAVGAGAIALAGSGIAYAYWTTAGSGVGSATAASAYEKALDITNAAPAAAEIVPGGSTTVSVTVANTNSGAAMVNTVSGTVAVHGSPANCNPNDFTIEPITDFGQVAAGKSVTKTTTLHFADSTSNQDGCKDATLDITWSSN